MIIIIIMIIKLNNIIFALSVLFSLDTETIVCGFTTTTSFTAQYRVT